MIAIFLVRDHSENAGEFGYIEGKLCLTSLWGGVPAKQGFREGTKDAMRQCTGMEIAPKISPD